MVISVKYLQLRMVLWYFCACGSCHVFGLLESINEFIIESWIFQYNINVVVDFRFMISVLLHS